MSAAGRRFAFLAGLALAAGHPAGAALAGSPVPVHPNFPITENTFYFTRLTCPDGPSGTLHSWTGNKAGWTGKITVRYAGGSPSTVRMTMGRKDRTPETAVDTPIDAPMAATTRDRVDSVVARANGIYRDVCLAGTTAQARNDAEMAANRAHLGIGLPE